MTRDVRVTLVNKYYPPHLGGIEYHLRDLAESLAARDGVDARVLVANEERGTIDETIGGVRVVRAGRAFAYASTPVAFGMRRIMRRFAADTDVFHLNFPYPWGEVAWLSAGRGVPSVVWYHSDIVRQRVLGALYAPVLERVMRRADAVIAGSPQMIESSPVLRRFAGKCRVVPYGIRTDLYDATPEVEARAAELRAGHRRPIVLFVGRLVYYKGVEVLLRALASVDADLVAIGSGPLEGALRVLAAELGVAERVEFLPRANDRDLRAWYRAADVFCLPSVAPSEAFGLVQVEAHASGTPVVSTRLGTGVEFANEDGVSGLTVPPNDPSALAGALNALLDDDELRRRMGEQAARRSRELFSVARMTDDVLAVYRDVIAGKA